MEAFRFSPRENRAGDIEWREWGAGSFEEARAAGKPVLLSISAVWCHWCHVMDETSLSDERNIKLINERYVPIRVDADRRPDIQDRYLMGGWPTVAALSAAGGILAGGTYMPPDGLARWLDEVADTYQERAEELEAATAGAIAAAVAEPSESRGIDPHLVRLQLDVLMDVFDDEYGGFGREPKFPNHPAMELLVAEGGADRESRYGRAVAETLDRMMDGGLFGRGVGRLLPLLHHPGLEHPALREDALRPGRSHPGLCGRARGGRARCLSRDGTADGRVRPGAPDRPRDRRVLRQPGRRRGVLRARRRGASRPGGALRGPSQLHGLVRRDGLRAGETGARG